MTNLATKLEELTTQRETALKQLNDAQTIVVRLDGAIDLIKHLIAAEMEEARNKPDS